MSRDPSGSIAPSTAAAFEWTGDALRAIDYCDPAEERILAADSWLVDEGRTLAIGLHRERFFRAVSDQGRPDEFEMSAFWEAATAAVPREGAWFPRVELQERRGSRRLVFRQRSAPVRARSVRLATSATDPRTRPTVKGPDLAAMMRLRVAAQARGADEAVILSPERFVVEGGYSALLWWRGDALCAPTDTLERIDSVTERSILTLATALEVEVRRESVKPEDLEGLEIWAANALHGMRIATAWLDGPQPAEEPGRLELWRQRLGRLTRPLDSLGT